MLSQQQRRGTLVLVAALAVASLMVISVESAPASKRMRVQASETESSWPVKASRPEGLEAEESGTSIGERDAIDPEFESLTGDGPAEAAAEASELSENGSEQGEQQDYAGPISLSQAAASFEGSEVGLTGSLHGEPSSQNSASSGESSSSAAAAAALAENSDESEDELSAAASQLVSDDGLDQDEPQSLDSNIANAKVRMAQSDMQTAAAHYHGHGHGSKGWLKMGAHTGKMGSFGWHAKYPVGGKGRR